MRIELPVVGATGIEFVSEEGVAAEREELDWLLTSGVMGRSGNVTRVLAYIAEEHFHGRDDRLKEYTIATEALGRRPDFDPQSDTIVRVTFHSLRKRLVEVYQHEGATRPLRLVIPPGHYAPLFLRQTPELPARPAPELATENDPVQEPVLEPVQALPLQYPVQPPQNIVDSTAATDIPRSKSRPWQAALLAFALLLLFGGWWWHRRLQGPEAAALAPPVPQETVRALLGGPRKPYVDHSGNTWSAAKYCEGGSNVEVQPQRIEGTEDAPLYLGGIRGIVQCTFPVTGTLYEVHLHFAETTALAAATRPLLITINAGRAEPFDVVDSAGGDGIATTRIVTNVAPENDGAIHIELSSETTLWNAVELLPAPSSSQLPVRIVAGSKSFTGDDGIVWSSDRYFSGGRHGQKPSHGKSGLGLYAADRIGRFRYNIPAVPRAHYRVRLFFREPFFGKANGGNGGPGSRIFDVACNGSILLRDFDILAEGGSEPIVKTFDHVQASASGRIELYFMPVVNYPMVSAIEVVPES